MQPTLWFGDASSTPTELTIREGEQVLGRAADADLRLSETFVSTYHARLSWQKGQLKVLDLNSTNGTLVNGVPVVGWTTLTDGDVIEFGGIEAVVGLPSVIDLDEPAASVPPPPSHESRSKAGGVPTITYDDADRPLVDHHLPDEPPRVPTEPLAPVTLRTGPPTGITITDIEAVTEGYGAFAGDENGGVLGSGPGYDGPFGGSHPESARGRERSRGPIADDGLGDGDAYHRPTPAFTRNGVSPIVIIIAVALLVVIILAAVFLS